MIKKVLVFDRDRLARELSNFSQLSFTHNSCAAAAAAAAADSAADSAVDSDADSDALAEANRATTVAVIRGSSQRCCSRPRPRPPPPPTARGSGHHHHQR